MTKKLQTNFLKKDLSVTSETYYDMLESLPPIRQVYNAFLVGEPTDHNKDLSGKISPRYALYFTHERKHYYGGLASVSDFESFLIDK